jgi:hypothetical protein
MNKDMGIHVDFSKPKGVLEHETLRNAALKRDCQCADDNETYALSTTFVKDCYTEFHENLTDCCVAGTRSDTRRLTGFLSFVCAP